MDDAFDLMLDVLTKADAPLPPEPTITMPQAEHSLPIQQSESEYTAKMAAVTDEIRKLGAPSPHSKTPHTSKPNVFDEKNNILNWDVRERFKNECSTKSLPLFSVLRPTTNTIEGYLSNVLFHERELIQEVIPDESIVQYRCNYGKVTYEGYTEMVRVKTTNRGRKKKPKKKKRRKVQGNGTDFNSQITCIVLSSLASPPDANGQIPMGAKVHKLKIFRTGKIQLPGVHQSTIDDAIASAQKLVPMMNFHLHAMETDPAKMTALINMNPVMKNYKFVVNIPSHHIIDLAMLRDIFIAERSISRPTEQLAQVSALEHQDELRIYSQRASGPRDMSHMANYVASSLPHPQIFIIRYTRLETKLSIKMNTPILGNVSKKTRINIFMRGRINILGAFHFDVTMQIYEYLHAIFDAQYCNIVVPEGTLNITPHNQLLMRAICTENIEQPTQAEVDSIVNEFINWRPEVVEFTDDEYNCILDMLGVLQLDPTTVTDTVMPPRDMIEYTTDDEIEAFINEC